MKYKCKIVHVEEEYVTVIVNNITLTGFSNRGIVLCSDNEAELEIELFDELVISKACEKEPSIKRKGDSLSYLIVGTLDVDEMKLKSVIDFLLEPEDLYDYAFLDGEMVQTEVLRFNFDFEDTHR